MFLENKLLRSKIFHKRFHPKIYNFLHQGFFVLLDTDKLEEANALKYFSLNKKNYFSLFFRDYGYEDFNSPKDYILKKLSENDVCTSKVKKIYLVTMPRMFSYIFNPVSFWLCFDVAENLILAVAEVNNTFKERHSYICKKLNFAPITAEDTLEKEKLFHVSPFFQVKGKYKFRFDVKKENVKIDINYYAEDKLSLATYVEGLVEPMNDRALKKYIFLYPFLTLKVIILIHYHALRLWLKGVTFYKKPIKIKKDIS